MVPKSSPPERRAPWLPLPSHHSREVKARSGKAAVCWRPYEMWLRIETLCLSTALLEAVSQPEGACSHLLTDSPPAVEPEKPEFAWVVFVFLGEGQLFLPCFLPSEMRIFVLEQMDKGSKAQALVVHLGGRLDCAYLTMLWEARLLPKPAWCAPGSHPASLACTTVPHPALW